VAYTQPKIVIIDDERDLCYLLSAMLSVHGFEIHSCYTLKDGLEALQRLRPDWVIMDNDLPDGRGWDEASNILQKYPSTNLINISANPDSERSLDDSRLHYLIKPLKVNSIVRLLKG
jgi:DNA-binding response OmpR family regulator